MTNTTTQSPDPYSDYIGFGTVYFGDFPEFIVTKPWPELACIQDYDAGTPVLQPDGKRTIFFAMINGEATYEVVRDSPYGYAYDCKLLPGSTYHPHKNAKHS